MAATDTTLTSGQRANGITLTANTTDTITFPVYVGRVRVTSENGAAALAIEIGTTAATVADPGTGAGASSSYRLPASVSSEIFNAPRVVNPGTQAVAPTVVKVKSTGAVTYTVEKA